MLETDEEQISVQKDEKRHEFSSSIEYYMLCLINFSFAGIQWCHISIGFQRYFSVAWLQWEGHCQNSTSDNRADVTLGSREMSSSGSVQATVKENIP